MQGMNNQRGFTLIELLMVVGILSTISVVAIPAYSKFFGQGTVEASQTELSHIQSAMDAMMAENGIKQVSPESDWIQDFSSRPIAEDPLVSPLYPNFLRNSTTRCRYNWDITGKLDQVCN